MNNRLATVDRILKQYIVPTVKTKICGENCIKFNYDNFWNYRNKRFHPQPHIVKRNFANLL